MKGDKFVVVVPGSGSLTPDPLEPGVLEHCVPGLRRAALNLAEQPVDTVTGPPIVAVLTLWPRGDHVAREWTADVIAAAFPWKTFVYPVAEWSRWGDDRPPLIGARIAGVKRMAFVQRRPELTPAQFAAHWSDVHAPLAKLHHPTLVRYTQNVVCDSPSLDAPPFAGIGELGFPSAEDYLHHRYDSETGEAILRHDVQRFLTPSGSRSVWVGEYPLV